MHFITSHVLGMARATYGVTLSAIDCFVAGNVDITRGTMSLILNEKAIRLKGELISKVEVLDVKDKIIFAYLPGDKLSSYVGDRVWEEIRKLGALSVVFIPEHMRVHDFNDKDLASIDLVRIDVARTMLEDAIDIAIAKERLEDKEEMVTWDEVSKRLKLGLNEYGKSDK